MIFSTPTGPAEDMIPVVPNDSADLEREASALYIETGGDMKITTSRGIARTCVVADFSTLPVGVRRVWATGTTATGIHAYVVP